MSKPIPSFRWLSRARVLDLSGEDIHDGDTITIGTDRAFKDNPDPRDVSIIRIRLLDVWAPEVTGDERTKGLLSREWVREWLRVAHASGESWPLIVETYQSTRVNRKTFDRWVADVWRTSDGEHLNSAIVLAGYATYRRTTGIERGR